MAVKFKRKLVGADGGKHPHLKNGQDFHVPFPTLQVAQWNLQSALMLISSRPVVAICGDHPTLALVKREIELLIEVVKG